MDTLEIDNEMAKDKYTMKYYGGTWSLDIMKKKLSYAKAPACFIVNSSPSSHPGSHWTAVFLWTTTKWRTFAPTEWNLLTSLYQDTDYAT